MNSKFSFNPLICFCFGSGDDQVEATKLANEANIQMNEATNTANRWIADQANNWNYRMFQEQNQWNLDQWNRENEYNSPKAQVQRYIEAGINPIWAIGSGNPGNAQQLTSAQALPAEVPTMQPGHVMPAWDSQRVQVLGNILNASQGLAKLGIEQQEADIKKEALKSTKGLQSSQKSYFDSLAKSFGISNSFNEATFNTRVNMVQQAMDKTAAEIATLKSQDKDYQAKQDLYDSMEALNKQMVVASEADIKNKVKELFLKSKELGIMQQNADTAEYNAQTQRGSLALDYSKHQAQVHQFEKQFESQNNSMLLRHLEQSRSYLDKFLGISGISDTSVRLGNYDISVPTLKSLSPLAEIEAVGNILSKRYTENPTPENLDAFMEFHGIMESLPSAHELQVPRETILPMTRDVQNPSVLP